VSNGKRLLRKSVTVYPVVLSEALDPMRFGAKRSLSSTENGETLHSVQGDKIEVFQQH
jgi:hypothetical protein